MAFIPWFLAYLPVFFVVQYPWQSNLADELFPEEALPFAPWASRAGVLTAFLYFPAVILSWHWLGFLSATPWRHGIWLSLVETAAVGIGPLCVCNFFSASVMLGLADRTSRRWVRSWLDLSSYGFRRNFALWSLCSPAPVTVLILFVVFWGGP